MGGALASSSRPRGRVGNNRRPITLWADAKDCECTQAPRPRVFPVYRAAAVPSQRSSSPNLSMDPSATANANATAAANPLAGLSLPDGLTMDNTYGAALLGTFFALMYAFLAVVIVACLLNDEFSRMYGVLLHQTYNYFRVHWADSPWTKLYVSPVLCEPIQHENLSHFTRSSSSCKGYANSASWMAA